MFPEKTEGKISKAIIKKRMGEEKVQRIQKIAGIDPHPGDPFDLFHADTENIA